MNENELIVVIAGDTSGLRAALTSADRELQQFTQTAQDVSNYVNGWSTRMAKWGLVINGFQNTWNILKTGVGIFTEMGTALQKVSAQTGIAVGKLSALKYAAEQTGANFDTAVDAMKTFQEQLGAAQLGDQGAIDKLGAVGIESIDYRGLGGFEQFQKLAEHIASIPDEAEQARTAIELFGDAGYQLLPMFQLGQKGIQDLCEEAERLGIVMSEEDAKQAEELSNKLNALKSSLLDLVREGIGSIAVPLTSLVDLTRFFVGTLSAGISWIGKFSTEIILLSANMGLLYGATKLNGIIAISTASKWTFSAACAKALALSVNLTRASLIKLQAAWIACMATNPLGWALLAVTAFTSIVFAINGTSAKLKKLKTEMQDAADKWDQESEAIGRKIDRLQELSKYEHLTNSEQAEMKLLLGQLASAGLEVNQIYDEQAGKLKEVAEGYDNVRRAIKKKEIDALKDANVEAQKNIETINENIEKVGSGYHWQSRGSRLKQMEELSGEVDQQLQTIRRNYERIRVLESEIAEEDQRDEKIRAQREKEAGLLKDSEGLESTVGNMEKSRKEKGLSEVEKQLVEVQNQIAKISEATFEGKLSEALEERKKKLEDLQVRLQKLQEEDEKAKKEAEKAKQIEDMIADSSSLADSVDSMKKSFDEKGLSEYEKKTKEILVQIEKIQKTAEESGMTEEMLQANAALNESLLILQELEKQRKETEKAEEETRKAEQERAENTQRLKDLTAELQNASLTASQKELKAFQDINAELEKRLANQHDLTEEEKKAAQEALRKNQEAQQNFIQEKLDPAQLHYQREMDDARSVLAIEQDEYLQALEKAGHDENAPEVQKAKREMEDAEAEISRLNIQGAEKEVRDAETDFAEKESAFQNAVSDEEKLRAKDELDAARQRLESARSGLFSLKSDASQKKVLEAGKQTQEKEQAQMSVRGSFSIWGIDSAVSSVPQQQLDYLKRITGFVNSILNQQKTEGVLV